MTRVETAVPLGAGATGTLVGWRLGPVWRRLTLTSVGDGFSATDIYWLQHGVFLGASLTLQRPGKPPATDEVWFRNGAVYVWIDAQKRRLNTDSRSTQYEAEQMNARRDSLIARLTALDAMRPTAP
jgi:hypothetical protein